MFSIEGPIPFKELLESARDEVAFYQKQVAEVDLSNNNLRDLQKKAETLARWASFLSGLEEGQREITHLKKVLCDD